MIAISFFTSCAVDDTVEIYPSPKGYYRFGLEAFEFVDQPFVFIHCHVVICNASDAQSRCAQGCRKNDRVRRDVGGHNVYSLAQGPITMDYAADSLGANGSLFLSVMVLELRRIDRELRVAELKCKLCDSHLAINIHYSDRSSGKFTLFTFESTKGRFFHNKK